MSAATERQPSDSRDHRSGHVPEPLDPLPAGRAPNPTGSYVGGAVVNVILLVLVNGWPGWEAVPFLTDRTPLVLGLVNASLVTGIVINVVLSVWHPPRLKAFGDLAIGAVGIAALVRIWQVFPVRPAGQRVGDGGARAARGGPCRQWHRDAGRAGPSRPRCAEWVVRCATEWL